MAKITFEPITDGYYKFFYDNSKKEILSKTTGLVCDKDKEKCWAHILIVANGIGWDINVLRGCCDEFKIRVKKKLRPMAE